MQIDSETIDSTNDEVIEDEVENVDSPNGDEGEDENTEEYTPREKQLYARLQKAKGLVQVDGKWVKPTNTPEPKKTNTNDFGYDVKAYLKASGITANEFDFVKQEMKASGITDVDELLENDYFKTKLEKRRGEARTADATPSGKRSGGVATNSVDYWLAKPFEEVPKEMRVKVLNARQERESRGSQFYNS